MKSKSLLGLAIGSSSVKLLELSKLDHRYCLEHYAVIPIEQSITAAIEDALIISGTKIRTAAIALPDTDIISKILPFNTATLSPDDIEEKIITDIHHYIHYPLNEICFDFDVINPDSVLLIVARTAQVNAQIALANQAGLMITIVDIHSHALERASTFMTDISGNITALIDVGKNNITTMVLDNKKIIFSRSEPLNTLDASLIHVERAFHFFSASEKDKKITHILLMGGGSYAPKLCTSLENQFSLPVSIANPFVDMVIAKHIDPLTLSHDARLLMTACGLALRSFEHESN
ncbi:MAG: type IV pilus biogenesis protein PilM [Gammaproteobacteria bacterium]